MSMRERRRAVSADVPAALLLVAGLWAAAAVLWTADVPVRLPDGWSAAAGWVVSAPPERLLLATGWATLSAAVWWLALSSTVYVVVAAAERVVGLPGWLVAAVRSVTVPAVRRVADRAVAAALVGSTVLSGTPAVAAQKRPPQVVVQEQDQGRRDVGPAAPASGSAPIPLPAPPSPVSRPWSPRPPTTAGPSPGPASPTATSARPSPLPAAPADGGVRVPADGDGTVPLRSDRPEGQPQADGGGTQHPQEVPAPPPSTFVVEPGDHLWAVAERQVAAVLGRRPSPGEMVGYWRRLVAANADVVRSGDPDLIFPGERLRLPPVGEIEGADG